MKFKIKNFMLGAFTTVFALAVMSPKIFAADSPFGDTPDDVDPSNMSALLSIIFWLVRIIIACIGIIPGIIKIVQGQSDENPRDRNSGIVSVVLAAAGVAATFAIEGWFK